MSKNANKLEVAEAFLMLTEEEQVYIIEYLKKLLDSREKETTDSTPKD